MIATAVIVAGGSGKRMGTSLPKQFLLLEDKPILFHTLEAFLRWKPDMDLAVVLPAAHFDTFQALAKDFLLPEHISQIHLCEGGDTRTASVWAGLQWAYRQSQDPTHTYVAIHDGVRPFIGQDILSNAFELAEENGASVVCVPVKASLRKQIAEGESVAVDRSDYFEVQTPQTFQLSSVYKAFEQRPHDAFTDDASLFQAMGGKVAICHGSYDNIKITTPEDLAVGLNIISRISFG